MHHFGTPLGKYVDKFILKKKESSLWDSQRFILKLSVAFSLAFLVLGIIFRGTFINDVS